MRTSAALALLIATGAACGQTPAPRARAIGTPEQGVAQLAADTESRWVPFALTAGNQIRFTVALNGRPVTAVLDTGVSITVLSTRSAAVEQARLTGGGQAAAIGGSVAIQWMPTRSVAFGGLTRSGGAVAVTALPAIATAGGTAVDMLVGRDLLGAHALDIDYPAKRFRLLPSGRLPFTGKVAPLAISPKRDVYESAVTLGGTSLRPMIVDTGDGAAITVTPAGWAAAGLGKLPATTAISYGLAGPAVTALAIVPQVGVGEATAREVEVRTEAAGGFSEAVGAAGRIGSGLLGRYRVLLDPGARRMVLSPAPGMSPAPARSTSGLLLGQERDRLKVLHVMANGPAALAGWRAGELICAVDGAPIAPGYAASDAAHWTGGTPGTVVKLTLCTGEERALTLRRFY